MRRQRSSVVVLRGVAVLVVVVGAQSLNAQTRWVTLSTRPPLLRMDTTTIDVRDGRTYGVWIEERYTRPRTSSDPKRLVSRYVVRIVVDCPNKRLKFVRDASYTADGQIIGLTNRDETTVKWVLPIPDSAEENYLSVCQRFEVESATLPAERRAALSDSESVIRAGDSAKWNRIVISNTDTHPEIDLDVSSLRVISKIVAAWTRWERMPNEATPAGQPYSHMIARVVMNCADEASARVAAYYYSAEGAVLGSSSTPADHWHLESHAVDSNKAMEVNEVCLEAMRKKLLR